MARNATGSTAPPLDATTIRQAIYLLQLQGNEQVLIIAARSRKNGGH